MSNSNYSKSNFKYRIINFDEDWKPEFELTEKNTRFIVSGTSRMHKKSSYGSYNESYENRDKNGNILTPIEFWQ